jgi:2-polyprenyl-3-methyl-5-hydroxy-6-metoxy-1,4-benzoquinol methylase
MEMQSTASQSRLTQVEQWIESAPCNADYIFPVVRELLAPLGPSFRALDVGCGNGFMAGQLLAQGCDVVGIDLNPTGIEVARRRYPTGRFEVAAAGERILAELGAEPFDVVVSTEVIEHLYDPVAFARGCFSALRPGGLFICSTPYHGYLKNLVVAASGRFDAHVDPLWADGHIKFWSRDTLSRLLRSVGFEKLDFRGAGRLPYLWKSMVMSARRGARV